MEIEKSKVLIQFLLIFRQSGAVLFFLYARRLRGYTATIYLFSHSCATLSQEVRKNHQKLDTMKKTLREVFYEKQKIVLSVCKNETASPLAPLVCSSLFALSCCSSFNTFPMPNSCCNLDFFRNLALSNSEELLVCFCL